MEVKSPQNTGDISVVFVRERKRNKFLMIVYLKSLICCSTNLLEKNGKVKSEISNLIPSIKD